MLDNGGTFGFKLYSVVGYKFLTGKRSDVGATDSDEANVVVAVVPVILG